MKNETFSWKKMLSLFNRFSPSYCSVAESGPDPTGTKLGLPGFLYSSISFGRKAFLLKIKHMHKCLLEQSRTQQGALPPGRAVLHKPSSEAACTMCSRATHVSFDFNMGSFGILCSKMWIWIQMSLNTSQRRNLCLSQTIKCLSIFN